MLPHYSLARISIDKSISTLVIIGFGILLLLGVVTSIFIGYGLGIRIDDSKEVQRLLMQTRAPLQEARFNFMNMSHEVAGMLIEHMPPDALKQSWQRKKQFDKNATTALKRAASATRNVELRNIIERLQTHDLTSTDRLEDELYGLALADIDKARAYYHREYRPSFNKSLALLDQALRVAADDARTLDSKANEHETLIERLAIAAVLLLCATGLFAAVFLGRAVKRLVDRAADSTQKNADLIEHSLNIICSLDKEGRFTRINGASMHMLGYAPEELEGCALREMVHSDDKERSHRTAAEIRAGRDVGDFRNRVIRKDGSVANIVWSARWSEEQQQMFCVAHDVTENTLAQESLRAGEERTRLIIETAHDAFIGMDATGRIIDWNPQATAMFGWSAEEALGKLVADLIIPAGFRDQHTHSLKQFPATKEGLASTKQVELPGLHRDGHELLLEFSISSVRVGDSCNFYAFMRDITARRQAERELQQAKETAESATRAKSEFLANMSHEIRTPMNGVMGLSKLLLRMPLPAQQREYVTLIDSSANSLLRLINDILDFSKMEAGKLEIEAIEFDLRNSIGATLKALASTANEKAVELTYHVAPTVPSCLIGDPVRLAQIIANLTGNALKFTEKGEVVIRVALESQDDARAVLHFSIADTGIGIARDKQAHIFSAFAQADSSTTREYGGTGLGLAIVSQLIALMQGTIRVESEPDKGTTFHFTIPFDIPHKPAAPAAYRKADALRNMRVLVIDDNGTNRLILGEMFESWGMHAVLAESGAQALTELGRAAVRGTPFRLVLLDSRMPQLGGFQLARAIRSMPEPNGTIIMMLSSIDVAGEIEQCQALGIARFLTKPVTQSELFDAIVAETGVMPDAGSRASENMPALAAKPARPLNVLVAEDHPINQRLVAEILSDRGHRFSIANNGVEVLQMLEQQSFDVILMDGQMPQMDGYQATREIRRREASTGRHMRIIALTAHAMKEDRERCIAAGMDDYIAKPIDPERLLEKLEAELRNVDVLSVDE